MTVDANTLMAEYIKEWAVIDAWYEGDGWTTRNGPQVIAVEGEGDVTDRDVASAMFSDRPVRLVYKVLSREHLTYAEAWRAMKELERHAR